MRIWIGLALLTLLLSLGCSSTSSYKDAGDENFRQDKYGKAIANYEKHLDETGDDYEAEFKRAAAYDQAGQSSRALAAYSSLIKKYPKQAEPRLFRARLLFQEHEAISALRDVDVILNRMDDVHGHTRVMALGLKGEIYYKQGDYQRAAESFSQAQTAAGDYDDFVATDSYLAILHNGAHVQFALGKFRRAKGLMEEYLRRKKLAGKPISPEDRQFHQQVLMYSGDYRSAQRMRDGG